MFTPEVQSQIFKDIHYINKCSLEHFNFSTFFYILKMIKFISFS